MTSQTGKDAGSADRIVLGRSVIDEGKAILGIELGSTRIKACLTTPTGETLETGSYAWENKLLDGYWTYSLKDVWAGMQGCYADLVANVEATFGTRLVTFRAMGVSAMMHGYLAFDADEELLVPFRTWRNTTTGDAAAELTELFELNIPLRWSIAHYYQAILSGEEHVARVAKLTTLAGYVHWKLTGRHVLGVGDASGMFPIDSSTVDYDAALLTTFDAHVADRVGGGTLKSLLPEVLPAGHEAGSLTEAGAALLDPTGELRPGASVCPPEGDAGTGMVATNAVRQRTGNVSVGTSIFAMVVLDKPLRALHPEIDMVTTPSGEAVAMVHCNNGADELGKWVVLFREAAEALGGAPVTQDEAFAALLNQALLSGDDAGGVLAYNYRAGEPITDLVAGAPALLRAPDAHLGVANVMRAQLYSVFATLAIGLEVLEGEGVALERLNAHGGVFRTAGIAQRFLAAAANTPIAVSESASEGGAWGIALLAAYLDDAQEPLHEFLTRLVFAGTKAEVVLPDSDDTAGFRRFLDRYRAGLGIQPIAAEALGRIKGYTTA